MSVTDVFTGNERHTIVITTVDPLSRRVEGATKSGGLQVLVQDLPTAFVWPRQGEYWTVERSGATWRLVGRFEEPFHTVGDAQETNPFPVEQMDPGDVRLGSPGSRIYDGDGNLVVAAAMPELDAGQIPIWDGEGWTAGTTSLPPSVTQALWGTGDLKPTATPVTTDPAGWLYCDGRSILRTDYPSLFTALGGASSPFGLADATHFTLPDYRDNVPVGASATIPLGSKGGAKTVAITTAQMPSHNHGGATGSMNRSNPHSHPNGASFAAYAVGSGTFATPAVPGTTSTTDINHEHAIGSEGSGQAHSNMQPYQACNWLIKT